MAPKKKPRLPAATSLSYQIQQMQQGGVYTPGVMPYEVVPTGMPGMNIPIPGVQNAVDGSALLYKQQMVQQRKDSQDFREQQAADRALATSQANFLDLQDKLFGDLHNEYQLQELNRLKEEYHIPENITSDIFQNPYRLKELEFSMSQALTSQKFKDIMGQVGTVNKMRESAYKVLTEDEYKEWSKEYDNYQFSTDGKYDIKKLAPSLYQKEKTYKDSDYVSWLRGVGKDYFSQVDLSNPAHLDSMYDEVARAFEAKGRDEAIRRGYIEDHPVLGVILTDAGKQLTLDQAEREQAIRDGKYQEWQKKKLYSDKLGDENRLQSDAIADQNRVERAKEDGSGTGSGGRKETETEKEARLELETFKPTYGEIDVNEKLPNGLTIKDAMWKAVKDGTVPLVKEEIAKHLKSKKAPAKAEPEIPDFLRFPGGQLSPAQQLMQRK